MRHLLRFFAGFILCIVLGLLIACATTEQIKQPAKIADPYQHYNQNTFRFNKKLDHDIVKPLATGYHVIPWPIRRSVGNFFDNVGEVSTVSNDILQARLYWTLNDTWRFLINSTLGILGLFDIASNMGLHKHNNTFGLTLTHWGAKQPSYFMLPIIGPSSTLDAPGIPVDTHLGLWQFLPLYQRGVLFGFKGINIRALFLDKQNLAKQLAFDPYLFMRSAYFQHRAYLVRLNNHPPLPVDEPIHPPLKLHKQN